MNKISDRPNSGRGIPRFHFAAIAVTALFITVVTPTLFSSEAEAGTCMLLERSDKQGSLFVLVSDSDMASFSARGFSETSCGNGELDHQTMSDRLCDSYRTLPKAAKDQLVDLFNVTAKEVCDASKDAAAEMTQ